ncbi:MAG: ornithine carbamoyltransferase [Propionibacteriales bacterium]|nr:ornithine carbamoyltransferase [Propionibacteriales bacterium]
MTRHLLVDDDLTQSEQAEVLALAAELKVDPYGHRTLAGPRSVAVLFDKPSTRTRISFEAGIAELGGHPMIIDSSGSQLGRGESVADTARILDRQVAAIVWRTGAQSGLVEMAEASAVPVVNGLTDDFHPCQLLADLLTITERLGDPAGRTLTYLGDGANNMAHSYLLAGVTAGMHVRISSPDDYRPDPTVLVRARQRGVETGGSATLIDDPVEAATGAHVLATDTWVSMGDADEELRHQVFTGHRLSEALVQVADPEAIVLHCLPAYRGKEIDASVLDGPRSVVWDEAENRRHAQKALLHWLLNREG